METKAASVSHLALDVKLQTLGDGALPFDVQSQHKEVLLTLAQVGAHGLRADQLVAQLAPATKKSDRNKIVYLEPSLNKIHHKGPRDVSYCTTWLRGYSSGVVDAFP